MASAIQFPAATLSLVVHQTKVEETLITMRAI